MPLEDSKLLTIRVDSKIPLHPKAIVQIWNSISPYNFEDAYDTWPGRRLVGGARKEIFDQLDPFLDCQGISAKDVELRPL